METSATNIGEGVWGRHATEEERHRLRESVAEYQRAVDKRRSDDAQKLGGMVRRYAISLGISAAEADKLVEVVAPSSGAGRKVVSRNAKVRADFMHKKARKIAQGG